LKESTSPLGEAPEKSSPKGYTGEGEQFFKSISYRMARVLSFGCPPLIHAEAAIKNPACYCTESRAGFQSIFSFLCRKNATILSSMVHRVVWK
jgi:hypothetical protein